MRHLLGNNNPVFVLGVKEGATREGFYRMGGGSLYIDMISGTNASQIEGESCWINNVTSDGD